MARNLKVIEGVEGVAPASQARTREAQARLLKAGEEVFARKGYDEAHVTDIAAAADCSIGTFYRRFHDKEALFRALHLQFAERMSDNIDRFFAQPAWRTAPTPEVLRTLVQNTARVIERHPGFFRALFQRTVAGAGSPYYPALLKADVHKGTMLAQFLLGRGEGAGDPKGFTDDCIFGLRTVEATLIVRSLRPETAADVSSPQSVTLLTRMLAGCIGIQLT